ncbi:DEAD/DEAH box helicase [Mucisphaera sp.]|uniref:DEAD/DEAH box helicase n=1 Tax=Mucisphaera sp. TaxID=2913024 RepID=UPI003D0E4498
MNFQDLPLAKPVLRAVADKGYTTATPIQAQAITPILEGRDVLGCAQTGTGKTAAFALPILSRLHDTPLTKPKNPAPRCLILAPTRELAVQIADSFRAYAKHMTVRGALVFGGVSQAPQVRKIRQGVDIIVATPGRLLDLMNQGHIQLNHISTLVLDEADRMLDMGFLPDIRRITAEVPRKRQTLLFSATMPGPIRTLADDLLTNPVAIQIEPEAPTVDRIDQGVYFVDKPHKAKLLTHLLTTLPIQRAIVFTRTKHGADKVVKQLGRANIRAEAIHGNKTQAARQRTLDSFRTGRSHILIATDIASRGIDVDGVSHVFNYDITHEPESYVHRIGRTARAGASGRAISFCDAEERSSLRAIEKAIRKTITPLTDHPDDVPTGEAPPPGASRRPKRPQHNKPPHKTRKPARPRNNNTDESTARKPKTKRNPTAKAGPQKSAKTKGPYKGRRRRI